MTREDAAILGGVVASFELAIAHIGTVLDHKQVIQKQELANSFKATAEALGKDVNNREMMALVLNQIAAMLEGKTPKDPVGAFLTVIQGGKSRRQVAPVKRSIPPRKQP